MSNFPNKLEYYSDIMSIPLIPSATRNPLKVALRAWLCVPATEEKTRLQLKADLDKFSGSAAFRAPEQWPEIWTKLCWYFDIHLGRFSKIDPQPEWSVKIQNIFAAKDVDPSDFI